MPDIPFQLKGPFETFEHQQRLIEPLLTSDSLRDVKYTAKRLEPPFKTKPNNPFTGKTFTNVDFSHTTISKIVFRNCRFENCLFKWTHLEDCEFYDCSFNECNPHKITFENTYIDPSVFEVALDSGEHWNIGMNLFQQLYDNATKMNQPEFTNTAEFNRKIWQRHVLNHHHPGRKKLNRSYLKKWSTNYLYFFLAGYGIRLRYLARLLFVFVVASVGINFFFWDSLNIVGRDGLIEEREWVEVLYYTATIPSGLGDLTPMSDVGRVIFMAEALVGVVIISFFVNWLVKRAVR